MRTLYLSFGLFLGFFSCGSNTSLCPAQCKWPNGSTAGSPWISHGDTFQEAYVKEWEREAHASEYSGQESEYRRKDTSSWFWYTQDLSDRDLRPA